MKNMSFRIKHFWIISRNFYAKTMQIQEKKYASRKICRFLFKILKKYMWKCLKNEIFRKVGKIGVFIKSRNLPLFPKNGRKGKIFLPNQEEWPAKSIHEIYKNRTRFTVICAQSGYELLDSLYKSWRKILFVPSYPLNFEWTEL